MASFRSELMQRLREAADPSRGVAAHAYMKSTMPFIGVGAVPLRSVCRDIFKAHRFDTAASDLEPRGRIQRK